MGEMHEFKLSASKLLHRYTSILHITIVIVCKFRIYEIFQYKQWKYFHNTTLEMYEIFFALTPHFVRKNLTLISQILWFRGQNI